MFPKVASFIKQAWQERDLPAESKHPVRRIINEIQADPTTQVHSGHNQLELKRLAQEFRTKDSEEISEADQKQLDEFFSELESLFKGTDSKQKFVDLDKHEFICDKLDKWVERNLGKTDEAKGEAWLYFFSKVDLMNATNLMDDINRFVKNTNYQNLPTLDQEVLKKDYIKELKGRFPPYKAFIENVFESLTKKTDDESSKENILKLLKEFRVKYGWNNYKRSRYTALGLTIASAGAHAAGTWAQANNPNITAGLVYSGISMITSNLFEDCANLIKEGIDIEISKKIQKDCLNAIYFTDLGATGNTDPKTVVTRGIQSFQESNGILNNGAIFLIQNALGAGVIAATSPFLAAMTLSALGLAGAAITVTNSINLPVMKKLTMLLNRHAARENSILKAKKEITSSPGIHSMQSSHEANTVKTIELHQTHKTRSAISYMSIASAGMASIFAGITLAGSIGVPPEVILTSYRAMIQMFFGGQGFIEDLAKLPEHAVNLKNLQEFLKAGQGLIEADQKKKSFAEMQGHKIEINNLSFSYPDKDVFKNVNLSISEGDFILLSGENGTGKSTLFGCLMGQTKAQSGEIRIGGIE
ncbi:MAG: ATP-binding cassette domain-containing protein, partial [Candidatus Caenarcaniphilales bacterium]|nr:ATP-binding cassette domain-containing protein [Candidatus Caenarcaniphilales bacterium]